MAEEVWVSSVLRNHPIYNKPGIREKMYGEDWAPPTHDLSITASGKHNLVARRKMVDAAEKSLSGFKLERTAFPEAMYVFSEYHWRRVKDWIGLPPGFIAVKGGLAQSLKDFDLGGTEMVELPIYGPDRKTLLPEPVYILNFDSRKTAFLPDQSRNLEALGKDKATGDYVWTSRLDFKDGDVAVSRAALCGADLWFDPRLYQDIFMSGALHDAICDAGFEDDFLFARVRIVGMH